MFNLECVHEFHDQYAYQYKVDSRSDAIKACKKHGAVLTKYGFVKPMHHTATDMYYGKHKTRFKEQSLFIWVDKA